MKKTLVAGVGNVFFADDGFGCEVARRLSARRVSTQPDDISVTDFGIRGLHLAYELSSGSYDRAIVIDAVMRGGAPGTLYVIEPDTGEAGAHVAADGHGIDLRAVFAMTRALGTPPASIQIIGCEVAEVLERVGLSDPVEQAVDRAIALLESTLATDAE